MPVRTFLVDGEWVVADDAGWLPGVYATEEDALNAVEAAGR